MAGPNAFLENTVVSFSFRGMTFGWTGMCRCSQCVFDFVQESVKLLITVNVSNEETIVIVQTKDVFLGQQTNALAVMSGVGRPSCGTVPSQWKPCVAHHLQT